MKRASGFVLVAFWVAFACALQVALLAFGPWVDFGGASVTRALVPDLGTCVLVAAVARIGRRDAVGLAIAATIGSPSDPATTSRAGATISSVSDGRPRSRRISPRSLRILSTRPEDPPYTDSLISRPRSKEPTASSYRSSATRNRPRAAFALPLHAGGVPSLSARSTAFLAAARLC